MTSKKPEQERGAGSASPRCACSARRDYGAEALEAATELRTMATQILSHSPTKQRWLRWAEAIELVVKQRDACELVLRHPLKVPLGGGPNTSFTVSEENANGK